VIAALALLGYAAFAAWLAPALLTPLTSRGRSVRAGLAAWLAAMASVLVSGVLAVQFSLRTVAADWPRLTADLCRSVAGQACTPEVYGSLLYQAGVAALAAVLTLAAVAALYRYGRRVQRSRRGTRAHAEAARLVGRAFAGATADATAGARADTAAGTPAGGPAAARRAVGRAARGRAQVLVLDDPRPAAYCVAGRPAAIVLTSAAVKVLDQPQLGAVVAHERAHLAHGDHLLSTLTKGLAAALPGVPLFSRGGAEIARLAEMSADDAAARIAGRRTVASALLALATGNPVPGTPSAAPPTCPPAVPPTSPSALRPASWSAALAAAAHAVPARVDRLLAPSRPAAAARAAVLLAAVTALFILTPWLLATLAR
jgi:Zn-dependent protease with chaperone function